MSEQVDSSFALRLVSGAALGAVAAAIVVGPVSKLINDNRIAAQQAQETTKENDYVNRLAAPVALSIGNKVTALARKHDPIVSIRSDVIVDNLYDGRNYKTYDVLSGNTITKTDDGTESIQLSVNLSKANLNSDPTEINLEINSECSNDSGICYPKKAILLTKKHSKWSASETISLLPYNPFVHLAELHASPEQAIQDAQTTFQNFTKSPQ